MKNLLVLIVVAVLGLAACNSDNGTTPQTQQPAQQSQGIQTAPLMQEAQPMLDIPAADAPSSTDREESVSEICRSNNFVGQRFRVRRYDAARKIITASVDIVDCPRLYGEVRRPGGINIMEFAGDAIKIEGKQIWLDTGRLPLKTRPKEGETLKVIWKANRR